MILQEVRSHGANKNTSRPIKLELDTYYRSSAGLHYISKCLPNLNFYLMPQREKLPSVSNWLEIRKHNNNKDQTEPYIHVYVSCLVFWPPAWSVFLFLSVTLSDGLGCSQCTICDNHVTKYIMEARGRKSIKIQLKCRTAILTMYQCVYVLTLHSENFTAMSACLLTYVWCLHRKLPPNGVPSVFEGTTTKILKDRGPLSLLCLRQ